MEVNERALSQAHTIGNAFNELSSQMYKNSDARDLETAKFEAQLNQMREAIAQHPSLSDNQTLLTQIDQLAQVQKSFSVLNEDLTYIKYQLNHIIESRNELIISLSKIAEPEHTNDITSQTDIELF
eukprot:TRINITY_DN25364_c0_g1_i1.p1 TRINITY_DN25364_c0_g1~~TRINITY_DN25364_c0_g1_i1.p1  ORF type:complete len:126 (-),score=17.25 TRINITY_DN25364_c0_g1_i1:89-466(-)